MWKYVVQLVKKKVIQTKKILLNKCQEFVKNKMLIARQELHSAQEAADNEQSNSSTDNYNTDKAMIQIEIEKYEGQLIEAQKLEKALKMINIDRNYEIVDLGSLVETNMGKYFLSIGLGKIVIDQDIIYAFQSDVFV